MKNIWKHFQLQLEQKGRKKTSEAYIQTTKSWTMFLAVDTRPVRAVTLTNNTTKQFIQRTRSCCCYWRIISYERSSSRFARGSLATCCTVQFSCWLSNASTYLWISAFVKIGNMNKNCTWIDIHKHFSYIMKHDNDVIVYIYS